jgi:hypothetical protein
VECAQMSYAYYSNAYFAHLRDYNGIIKSWSICLSALVLVLSSIVILKL